MKEFFMKSRLARLPLIPLSILLIASFCLIEVSAQTRKKRRARRVTKPPVVRPVITNPTITPEGEMGSDVKIVSTADDTSAGQVEASTGADPKPNPNEEMQQTINGLSNRVERLTDKLGEMQENDRTLVDLERLTRAEQRAESLRNQLLENEGKLADLQSRLEQVEFASKPENIERANATYGSTRPEEAREARRRQLEKEKVLIQNQIRILETGRVRLEAAIATSDREVDLLRHRIETKQEQRERTLSDTKKP
jgi:hypothetical protein